MALEAAAVSGSAALGCSTIGIALYANAVAWRSGVSEDASQETPGLASSILTTSCRQVMKVLEAPSLVSAALSDPADDLRLAASQGEILATAAECSVNGKPPTSGFVTFNGEVLKVGTNLASAIPIIALGGAEVSLQGKDITIVPKESPALVVQLDTFSQATEWEATLKTCARKLSHPAKRLEEVLHQASDFQKAIDDLNIQVQRVSPRHHAHHHAEHGTGHGHHGHGQEHGQHSECDGHAHHDGDGHGHHDGHQKGGESNQKTIFMAAEAYSKIEELKNSLLMAESRLTQQDEELLQLQARNAALKHDNGHLQDDLLFFKSSQGSVGSDLQSRAVRQDQIISDQEIQIAELQNDLHQQKLQHDREMEAALADNLALQKEVNELYVQLDGELSKETLAPDEPQLQQAQAEMGSLQTVLSAANQELEQMRARFNAAEKELAIQTENQAKSSLALVEKHQEELDFLNAELAKAKVQADTYKEQAEQANQANRELNVKLQEEKLAVKETPDVASPLDDTDGNALRGDKKLTARELQAIQTHLQSVHKRAGAAEARSRTLEKDKASNEALKQMLSEQKEHYENALQALSQKLEEQSTEMARRKQSDELSPSLVVSERTKQMETERFAFGQELELLRGQPSFPMPVASVSSGARSEPGMSQTAPFVPARQAKSVLPPETASPYRARRASDQPMGVQVLTSPLVAANGSLMSPKAPAGVSIVGSTVITSSKILPSPTPIRREVNGRPVTRITQESFGTAGQVSRGSFGTPPSSLPGLSSLGTPLPSLWST